MQEYGEYYSILLNCSASMKMFMNYKLEGRKWFCLASPTIWVSKGGLPDGAALAAPAKGMWPAWHSQPATGVFFPTCWCSFVSDLALSPQRPLFFHLGKLKNDVSQHAPYCYEFWNTQMDIMKECKNRWMILWKVRIAWSILIPEEILHLKKSFVVWGLIF